MLLIFNLFYIVIGIFHIFICSTFYSYLIIKQHFLKEILKCYVLIPLKKTPRKLIFKARDLSKQSDNRFALGLKITAMLPQSML